MSEGETAGPFVERESAASRVDVAETDAGTFRLAYGVHLSKQNLKDLGDKPGALALENHVGADQDPVQDIQYVTQYRDLLAYAAKAKLPVFITGPTIRQTLAFMYYFVGASAFELSVAANLLDRTFKKSDFLDRRDVLRKALKGIAGIVGGYVAGDVLAKILVLAGDPREQTTQVAGAVSGAASPQSVHMIKVRDIILADNAEAISLRYPEELRGKDTVGVYGTLHKRIGHWLRAGHRERVEELRRTLAAVPFPVYVSAQDLSIAARMDFDGATGWRVTELYENRDVRMAAIEAGLPES